MPRPQSAQALVRRHVARLEACLKRHVDRASEKILVLVIAYMGENPIRRKHKVFFATLVSGELGDPKPDAKHKTGKREAG